MIDKRREIVDNSLKQNTLAKNRADRSAKSSQKSGADLLVNLAQKRSDESSSADLPPNIEKIPICNPPFVEDYDCLYHWCYRVPSKLGNREQ